MRGIAEQENNAATEQQSNSTERVVSVHSVRFVSVCVLASSATPLSHVFSLSLSCSVSHTVFSRLRSQPPRLFCLRSLVVHAQDHRHAQKVSTITSLHASNHGAVHTIVSCAILSLLTNHKSTHQPIIITDQSSLFVCSPTLCFPFSVLAMARRECCTAVCLPSFAAYPLLTSQRKGQVSHSA